MAHTPLLDHIHRAAWLAQEATERNLSVDQVFQEQLEKTWSRRQFLKRSALLAAAAALPSLFWQMDQAKAARTPERVIVVGAGLAGLTCAYRLKQAGIMAEVYEASNRVGGRCWTRRGYFAGGQIAEHGGELIDQSHTSLRQLVQELDLELDNLLRAEKNGTEPLYYFDGSPYTYAEATRDIQEIWQKMHRDVSDAGYPTLYNRYTRRGYELDHMSIRKWIEETVPGGLDSRLGKLLDIAYTIEYGADTTDQSALNLLYLLAYSGQGQLRIFGPSNEKYHIRGGNDQIAKRMARQLDNQITTDAELVAIKRNSDGRYTLTFEEGSSRRDVTADKVVLTVPFSILRSRIDYRGADFRELKRTAIEEYGMGTNSKLHVQFVDRHWETLGCNGETIADTGYQNTWDVTRSQSGDTGLLVNYTGGKYGDGFASDDAGHYAERFLRQIERVLPGITDKWNGMATLDYWPGYIWTRGSYAYYRVGQYTRFAGIEREREGNCYFAGEHTSIDFQGYLNGAVQTGESAAKEVAAELKSGFKRSFHKMSRST